MVEIAPVTGTTDYMRLTAAELLEIMKLSLGGKGIRSGSNEKLIKVAIVAAAKLVWNHANWRWRCLPYTLTTTASQAYTTLPSDYRSHRVIRHLWYGDAPSSIARYVPADLWPEQLRQNAVSNGTTAGRPAYCTVRLRTIDSSNVFVAEWTPTPDDAYTVYGFEYLKALPDIDFTSDDNLFPEGEFDVLWQAASYRLAMNQGLQVGGATEGQRVMSIREFNDLMESAEDKWAIEDSDVVSTLIPDVDGQLSDLMSQQDNRSLM